MTAFTKTATASLALSALLILPACVSAREYNAERAYARCDNIKVKTSRDKCIAAAIEEAQRERESQAADMRQREDDAEKRELGRVIAGAEQD